MTICSFSCFSRYVSIALLCGSSTEFRIFRTRIQQIHDLECSHPVIDGKEMGISKERAGVAAMSCVGVCVINPSHH